MSFFSNVRLDAKSKQRLRGATRNDLTNIDQNFGDGSLQSRKFFIFQTFFFQALPFGDLKGTEVLCFHKIRLDAKYKQRLRHAARNDLRNRDQNLFYRTLRSLKFFIALATFHQRFPIFWAVLDEITSRIATKVSGINHSKV